MKRTLKLWELNTNWDELVIISKLLYRMPRTRSKTKNPYIHITRSFAYKLTLFTDNEEEKKTVWRFIRRNSDFTGKRVSIPPIFKAEVFYQQMKPVYPCLKENVKLLALQIILKEKSRSTSLTVNIPYGENFARTLYKIRINKKYLNNILQIIRQGWFGGFFAFALWSYYRAYNRQNGKNSIT